MTVQHNDSIVDIAIRAFGAVEGILPLWADNGLASVDAAIAPGDELLISAGFAVAVSRQQVSDREKKQVRHATTQKNQNILDMAIQEYGATEGLMAMIWGNGLLPDQKLEAGIDLLIAVEDVVKPLVTAYFRRNNISVATGSGFSDVREVDLWIDEIFNFVTDEKGNKIIV